MLWLAIPGKVPSKSNSYQIITTRTKGGKAHGSLKKTDVVRAFEWEIARRAGKLCEALGGCPFPAQRVALWLIWHRRAEDRYRRDLDNIEKVSLDGLTQGGIWTDDSQVSYIEQQVCFDTEEEWLEIVLFADPVQPQPMPKKGKRPQASRTVDPCVDAHE